MPKNPTVNPEYKRLAITMPDHVLSYANFEGKIPEGEYGAGKVEIWDKGTYKNIKIKNGKIIPIKKCIENGTVEIWLEGKKLKGAFALIKMKNKNWLLIKMRDDDQAKNKFVELNNKN